MGVRLIGCATRDREGFYRRHLRIAAHESFAADPPMARKGESGKRPVRRSRTAPRTGRYTSRRVAACHDTHGMTLWTDRTLSDRVSRCPTATRSPWLICRPARSGARGFRRGYRNCRCRQSSPSPDIASLCGRSSPRCRQCAPTRCCGSRSPRPSTIAYRGDYLPGARLQSRTDGV